MAEADAGAELINSFLSIVQCIHFDMSFPLDKSIQILRIKPRTRFNNL